MSLQSDGVTAAPDTHVEPECADHQPPSLKNSSGLALHPGGDQAFRGARKAGGCGSGRNRYCRIPVLAFRAGQASQLNRILVRCARSRRRSRRRVRSTDRYASVPTCRAAYVAPSVTEALQALWRNRNKNNGRLIVLRRTCRPFALTGARPGRSEEGRRLVLPAQHQRSRRIQERLLKSFSPTPGLEPDRDEGKRLWCLGAIKWPSSQAARGASAERRPDSWHNAARLYA